MSETTQLFAVINERGAVFGPFDSTIAAVSFADEELGLEHAWRLVRIIRPPVRRSK